MHSQYAIEQTLHICVCVYIYIYILFFFSYGGPNSCDNKNLVIHSMSLASACERSHPFIVSAINSA